MEAERSSKTSVTTYRILRRHVIEKSYQSHRSENLKKSVASVTLARGRLWLHLNLSPHSAIKMYKSLVRKINNFTGRCSKNKCSRWVQGITERDKYVLKGVSLSTVGEAYRGGRPIYGTPTGRMASLEAAAEVSLRLWYLPPYVREVYIAYSYTRFYPSSNIYIHSSACLITNYTETWDLAPSVASNLIICNNVFWDVSPYILVDIYWYFGEMFCVEDSLEKSINIYQTTRRHIPADLFFTVTAIRTPNLMNLIIDTWCDTVLPAQGYPTPRRRWWLCSNGRMMINQGKTEETWRKLRSIATLYTTNLTCSHSGLNPRLLGEKRAVRA
jgi:hypothetical protein